MKGRAEPTVSRPTPGQFDPEPLLASLSSRPGVYCMLDAEGKTIYVGKARNLKNRVSSYFRGGATAVKTAALLRHVADIRITLTNTETEALLLEDQLVKKHQPRYNILLRDDKSFPYVRVSMVHDFPRLSFYRGAKKKGHRYFGPYPSAKAVRESLGHLQRLFQVRQCEDSFFANRSRPCLQHQIKRCSAPCVGLVSRQDYAADVEHAVLFLQGREAEVRSDLIRRMEQAAEQLDYERAAHLRDQVARIERVQERQFVTRASGDVDVVAAAAEGRHFSVAVMFIRGGRNLGSRNFYPRSAAQAGSADVLSSFISQYYLGREAPAEIIVSDELQEHAPLLEVISERAGHRVQIKHRVRGDRARWLEMASTNARHALQLRVASAASLANQFDALKDALDLEETPTRLECFDISHTGGEETVASCVVFGPEGAHKSEYRRFNIKGVTPGDDYGAMNQALQRRYTRIRRGEAPLPDVLFVDGGKGQVAEAAKVLEEMQLDSVQIVGVAKGSDRRPGDERLILLGQDRPTILPADSPALHLIQQVRDEAHRFAISGHRSRRAKARTGSVLESIPGLGPKRRRELLKHFGGLQGVTRAGVEDLAEVHGISRKLAATIYETFHGTE
ncbi:MAG: excinuclease ABC subunit UvrC [Gammaproteobacteria bacterium]|nr:excinuclease ABC subunit UvrC [Gammaproteobacteria bacterium]NNF60461.1 excinuclease ABC subunit UvrC [Gammaproteobacteria bacterium]